MAAVKYGGGHCTTIGPPRTGCDTIQEWYNYSAAGGMLGKRIVTGRAGNLNATMTYDDFGRVTNITYPSWNNNGTTVPGSSYDFGYDNVNRLNTMTNHLTNAAVISGVTFGVAGEVLSVSGILNETRQYNSLFQLTNITVPGALNINYTYSATQNNGKLVSQSDVLSGEQVAYTYDALNRLATAQTTQAGGTQWGQSYNYL